MITQEDLEKAAELGARRALKEVGLDYPHAADDIRRLRDLMGAFALAKKTVITTIVRVFTVAVLVAVAAYVGTSIAK